MYSMKLKFNNPYHGISLQLFKLQHFNNKLFNDSKELKRMSNLSKINSGINYASTFSMNFNGWAISELITKSLSCFLLL